MKRTILTLATGLLFSTMVMGQGADRTNAIMAFKDYTSAMGDLNIDKANKALLEAKEYIDKAYSATPTDHKTLFYRGSIYAVLGTTLEDPTQQSKAPEDLCSGGEPKFKEGVDPKKAKAQIEEYEKIALQSFTDALANPSKKDDFSDQIKLAMSVGSITVFNCGSKFYNEKKYKEAVEAFQQSIALKEVIKVEDTLSYYNSALCYERLNQPENEARMWQKCIDLKYKVDGSYAYAYSSLANAYIKMGKPEEAIKAVQAGKAIYPKDQGLIIAEVNYYLGKGDNGAAEKAINEAIAIDNKNATLYFALGSVYDNLANPKTTITTDMNRAEIEKYLGAPKKCEKMKQDEKEYDACTYGNRRVIYDGTVTKKITGSSEVDLPAPANRADLMTKAEGSYKKAIEIDPMYFDALYNLGAMKYNEGANMMNKINDIADDAEYNKEKAKAEGFFKEAQPYIEKARQVNGKDRGNLEMLKNIYTRLGELDKANEINAILKGN